MENRSDEMWNDLIRDPSFDELCAQVRKWLLDNTIPPTMWNDYNEIIKEANRRKPKRDISISPNSK